MSRKVTVEFELDDEITNEQFHEALCLTCHEGVGIGDTEDSPVLNVGEVTNIA